jgi:site-specific recombinase XerD
MSRVYEPRKLPLILSIEEVTCLLEATGGLKYKAALSIAYGAGLRASEVAHLKVSDIDSSAWFFGFNKARVKRTAMPCSRRHCPSCYVPGIDMPAHSG